MSNTNQDNRSASQKISDLENAFMSLYQTVNNVARDMMTVQQAIKLLGNKVDSIVKASAGGEVLSDAVIERIMIQNNIEELKNKVKNMVERGAFVLSEQVDENSFVVGEELEPDSDAVVNPRAQFAIPNIQDPEARGKLIGTKAGDTVRFKENQFRFKVLEVYSIQQSQPKIQEAVPAEAAPADESPAQAPAQADVAPAVEASVPAQDVASASEQPAATA